MTAAKKSKAVAKKAKPKGKTKGNQLELPAFAVAQGEHTSYVFSMPASELWKLVEINRRSEDKREGYQRALSPSRVRSIAKYISGGGVIPGAIVISLDEGEFDDGASLLTIPGSENLGWVIDGQHRLAGAFEASEDGVDDFESWTELGTGTAAEIQAGEDLLEAIQQAFADDNSVSIALKLD